MTFDSVQPECSHSEDPPTVMNRGGAPRGNANRARHGLSALQSTGRVPLKMPGGYHLRRALRKMHRELIADVTALRGREPSLYELALLNSASRHEARARLLERYLHVDAETEAQVVTTSRVVNGTRAAVSKRTGMSVMERAELLERIGRATDARDRVLRQLGLDVPQQRHPWSALKSITANVAPASPAARQRTQDGQDDQTIIPDSG